jgi:hypothetical protein
MQKRAVEADGADGAKATEQAEAAEDVGPQCADALAANLVTGKAVLFDEGDVAAAAGKQDRRHASRRPSADDDRFTDHGGL